MATYEEIEKTLQAAIEAAKELRQATSDAHSARKALITEAKKCREEVTTIIVREVTEQVGQLADASEQEMRDKVIQVIARIEADWRDKLGLANERGR